MQRTDVDKATDPGRQGHEKLKSKAGMSLGMSSLQKTSQVPFWGWRSHFWLRKCVQSDAY